VHRRCEIGWSGGQGSHRLQIDSFQRIKEAVNPFFVVMMPLSPMRCKWHTEGDFHHLVIASPGLSVEAAFS